MVPDIQKWNHPKTKLLNDLISDGTWFEGSRGQNFQISTALYYGARPVFEEARK